MSGLNKFPIKIFIPNLILPKISFLCTCDGNYNGDKRALTKNQIEICNRRRINPIPPQQMFVEFTKPIHDQLRSLSR